MLETIPKVSVLMPIYNTNPGHLRESVSSILEQTFTDFEFLILNDSPDNTELDNIISSFRDSRIKYVRNEHNMGISAARNKLLDMARGEYVAVMDHDDISLPERFAKEVAYLDAHPEVGVCSCWAETTSPGGDSLHFPENDSDIRILLMDVCAVLHPAAMIRKSVLRKRCLRYEDEFSPAEDYCLWLKLLEHTHFHNVPEVLFLYRNHVERTSEKLKRQMMCKTARLHQIAHTTYPILWQLYREMACCETTYKLFQCIPIIKIKTYKSKWKLYLFNHILLMSSKTRRHLKI